MRRGRRTRAGATAGWPSGSTASLGGALLDRAHRALVVCSRAGRLGGGRGQGRFASRFSARRCPRTVLGRNLDVSQARSGTPTKVEQLAQFACAATYEELSDDAREQLKLRVLDSLGCAFGALGADVPEMPVRKQVVELGGTPLATMIGFLERTAPDRAALYNGALVRYLDFNDSFLSPGETCHPSDNLAPVLSAAEYAHADGRTLLLRSRSPTKCRSGSRRRRRCGRGFDHTTQGVYGVAAGVARALGLGPGRAANAIAIAGTSLNALRVRARARCRTGRASHTRRPRSAPRTPRFWPCTGSRVHARSSRATRASATPSRGRSSSTGLHENLEAVTRTILKKFNAEIHSQSAIEALLELRSSHGLDPGQVERIGLDTFQVAYDIIGGGEEGPSTRSRPRRRPTTLFLTCSPSHCSTARCCPSNTFRSGLPPATCRTCCGGSWSVRTTGYPSASPNGTPPASGCTCATAKSWSESSTTTRASPPGP